MEEVVPALSFFLGRIVASLLAIDCCCEVCKKEERKQVKKKEKKLQL